MKTQIQAVKGTREFYPPQMEIRRWLYAKIEAVSQSYGYQEWDGPFLEKIDLYAAKSGEELVKEQSFVFPDRGGDLIALRPELTPSLARMVAARQNELVYPLRLWSFGPFWRYERPQKGRTREFFQWNIDMIGVSSPEADAELLAIGASFLKTVGLLPNQVKILVNHRQLMDAELMALGVSAELKKQIFKLIDRRDKMSAESWATTALEAGLNDTQLSGLVAILEDKNLWKKSPDLVRIFSALSSMGLAEFVEFDPRIIRGLDYYTGVVFEAWDLGGDGRAVLGGCHYENLIGDVGGNPLGGVGFAMGDVMVTLLLEKYGCLPALNAFEKAVLVTVFDDSCSVASLKLAAALRENGVKTILYPENAKLPKQFKFADRMNIKYVMVIGPDEMANGKVTVKDLNSGTQEVLFHKDAIQKIKHLLA